jgi:hypothetical protein
VSCLISFTFILFASYEYIKRLSYYEEKKQLIEVSGRTHREGVEYYFEVVRVLGYAEN